MQEKETKEELENTKRIKKIEDIEINEKEKEITKEIKNLNELNENKVKKDDIPNNNKKKQNDSKKTKLIIIIGAITIFLLVIIIICLILFGGGNDNSKKEAKDKTKIKEKNNYSDYVKAINKSVKNGSLIEEINKALTDNSLEITELELISLDIDSDNEQELIAYAEGWNEKYLLHFEVDDEVSYEDSYKLDSSSSIGYTYSIKEEKNYWYVENEKYYTIIEDTKLVIKEEDFLKDFFAITKEYKKKPFLENAISYKINDKLDALELEKNQIKEEDILKDNNTSLNHIKEEADKYIKNIEAEEQKKKEAEEAARKEAENTFKLEGKTLHYGKYTASPVVTTGYVIINSNGSGEVDGKSCTWEFGKHEFSKDSSTEEKETKESVNLTCTDKEYSFTSLENDMLSNGADVELKLEK